MKFETMQWMKKAGCVLVTVGYESANGDILKNIEKRITPDMILEFSKNTRKAGILVHAVLWQEIEEKAERLLKRATIGLKNDG